jgi:hypothetical protein
MYQIGKKDDDKIIKIYYNNLNLKKYNLEAKNILKNGREEYVHFT